MSTKILAKLLSQEDLDVVFSAAARTASFNLKSRVLTLPKSMPEISEGLVLHEVGHALYTPEIDGPIMLQKYGALVNVLEDARIEKKIKSRYPGSLNKFKEMYEVYEDKIRYGDVCDMKLIDRLNLFANALNDHDYAFNDQEQEFADRMMKTVTFDDVVALADDIKRYILDSRKNDEEELPPPYDPQENEEEPQVGPSDEENDSEEEESEGSQSELGEEESDEEDEGETGDAGEKSDEESDEEGEASPGDAGEKSDEESDEEGEASPGDETEDDSDADSDSDSKKGKSDAEEGSDKDVEHDDDFQSDLQDLVDNDLEGKVEEKHDDSDIEYFVSRGNLINVNVQTVDDYIREDTDRKELLEYRSTQTAEIREKISKTGTYMAQQFERQKKADEMSRTSVSNSGSLNTRRLHLHSISDDIFNTIETLKEGKSHGVQLLVDYSGSMQHKIMSVVEQSCLMIDFCQKAQIPYEVYGFTSPRHNTPTVEAELGYLAAPEALYYLIASSTQSKADNEFGVEVALRFAGAQTGWHTGGRESFMSKVSIRLTYTPLQQALVGMFNLTERFKLDNNVQVTNLIVFTDGHDSQGLKIMEGGTAYGVIKNHSDYTYGGKENANERQIIDGQTRKLYTVRTKHDVQPALFQMMEDRLGVNIVFIKMLDTRKLKNQIFHESKKVAADTKELVANPLVTLTDGKSVTTILMKIPKFAYQAEQTEVHTKASFKRSMKGNKESRIFANLVVDAITANFA